MSIHRKLIQARSGSQQKDLHTSDLGVTSPFQTLPNDEQTDNCNEQEQIQDFHPQQENNQFNNYVQNISEKDKIEEIQMWAQNFNSSKIFMRPTTDCFPKTKKLMLDTKFKYSIVISPFGSQDATFPVATTKAKNIIRCDNCRAYINPFCKFLVDGYKYQCNICDRMEAVPNFYYCPLDNNGYRTDFSSKPELSYGSFDIIAGQEYISRAPMPPTFTFLIDVSKYAVESGMLAILSNSIKDAIDNDSLAGEERTQVCVITFDSTIHIYNLKSSLKQPQMFVLSDLTDLELPIPDDLVVTLKDSKEIVYALFESLPKMFENTLNNGSCLTLALDIASKLITPVGGRLFIFQASPSVITEPVFVSKSELKGSDTNQNSQQSPSSPHFRQLCSEMHQNFINTSIFIFSETYKNIINLGEMARYLNGDIFYYYDKLTSNRQFKQDLTQTLEKQMSWESVFRIRITSGFKISNINGNFTVKSTDLLSYPCDENKTLIYDIEMDDTIIRGNNLSIQTALLYTTSQGERRIRTHNYIIPLTSDPTDIYNAADGPAVVATLARTTIYKLYYQPIPNLKNEIIANAKRIYLASLSLNRSKLHDSLSQFPLGILGVLKHQVFSQIYSVDSLQKDVVNCIRIQLNTYPVDELITHLIPYLFCIDDMIGEQVSLYDEDGQFIFPPSCPTAFSSLGRALYLMDIGTQLILYVNTQGTDWNFLTDVLGTTEFNQQFTEENLYANGRNKINEQLFNLVSELRKRKTTKECPLNVVIGGNKSPLEQLFYYKLIEDKLPSYVGGYNASYGDFLNMLS